MPALAGEIVTTLTDELGNPWFVIYQFYNQTTGVMRDATQLTSRGNRTGALIVDNMTGHPQKVNVIGTGTFNITANGQTFSAAQLASAGYNTIGDMAGLSPEIA
jgi:hypothetical protein